MGRFFVFWIYVSLPIIMPLVLGWRMDRILGDPPSMPHLIVGYGKLIARYEKQLNKPDLSPATLRRRGRLMGLGLTLGSFLVAFVLLGFLYFLFPLLPVLLSVPLIFYCLAGTTLAEEVKQVFAAVEVSLDAGRVQVSRIVGRDTSKLSAQEIRIAALETQAENLNDGVIAPIFYYFVGSVFGIFLGCFLDLSPLVAVVPATALMLCYKMVNTLDSMVGYRSERYLHFGRFSAIQDDVWGWIPARLTAFLLLLVDGKLSLLPFVRRYGSAHLSPNSGYPEAAMAALLNCRFGGPHDYFGKEVYKPYIGETERRVRMADARRAIRLSFRAESLLIILLSLVELLIGLYCVFCYFSFL
ncbi:adenosylcobinamide-phosphate synthase [Porphyromonas crevioricanis JCM 15906]|uniref:Cobalamin biosynthesis protein CobD n=2 Tax=Porphyromonas crevioricanis TaxID=393921 RepID=T1CPF9_9PORP|nr:adenosylcobinamide-phosphate synthase [Porphyromonas crevioricanis JCM 15906]SJZ61495.1 adenosylcobinamide-phosphate synthase [Porphyromonas crevioricanis]